MFFSFTKLILPPSFQEIYKTKLYSLNDRIANNYRCFSQRPVVALSYLFAFLQLLLILNPPSSLHEKWNEKIIFLLKFYLSLAHATKVYKSDWRATL